MKTSKKITIFLIILAIVIASVIVARHFIGKVFNEGEILLRTKNEIIIAPFKGVLGKREIAQGVLGTESFILTLDDTSSICLLYTSPSPRDRG